VRKRPVQVRFVGCGDAFGSGGRFQACILLHAPGHNGDVLLDCGASSLIALKQQRQDPNQIGLVLVSHLHGDHFGGLPFLILDGQFTHRTRPLYVAGPAGVGQRVQAAMEVLFPGSTRVRRRFPVHFHQLTDRQPLRFDPAPTELVVIPFAVVHASGAPALALRVTWQGHTIAYTGDTEWTEALVELASGAELLIAEGYTDQRGIRFHLDVASLRRHAGRLAARRIILTHLSADVLARADELGWETATDGMTLQLAGGRCRE
jgi:ribonuclease BN (tRNA processing enzyme)